MCVSSEYEAGDVGTDVIVQDIKIKGVSWVVVARLIGGWVGIAIGAKCTVYWATNHLRQ